MPPSSTYDIEETGTSTWPFHIVRLLRATPVSDMDSSYEARAKQALAIAAATNSDALIKKRKANNDVSGPTAEATG